jgi:hypothetical protein
MLLHKGHTPLKTACLTTASKAFFADQAFMDFAARLQCPLYPQTYIRWHPQDRRPNRSRASGLTLS